MKKYVITDDTLSAIADAIRAKTGKADTMTTAQMPAEISGIITGIDAEVLENLPVVLNFANGNQTIAAPEGYLVKSAILQKPDTLVPENIVKGVVIAGIEGTHEGGGSGELPADVHTVTFMNGDTELFSRPVYIGDDCPNPVDQKRIDTPQKASTAQYNYGFLGWGAADNGAYDSNILKNITEDKTVYAVYTAIVRFYTITYLDSDGVTVLKTEQVAYGAVPSYTPTKEGAAFDKWTPTPIAVTGDATYTAVWSKTMVVVAQQTITTSYASATGYGYNAASPSGKGIDMGKLYKVIWNGVTYECTPKSICFRRGTSESSLQAMTMQGIGNPYNVTRQVSTAIYDRRVGSASGELAENTGEPFWMQIYSTSVQILTEAQVKNASVYVDTTA